MKLNLAETFTSIQGEGILTGTRMYFIRFGGCSVRTCPLHPSNDGVCDENWRTKFTLDATGIREMADDALDDVGDGGWVCVTGGEPAEQPEALELLINHLHDRDLAINLQTSGALLIPEEPLRCDWLTVSPKTSVDALRVRSGEELKLVYMGQSMYELAAFYRETNFIHYQLQPLWCGDECTNMKETIAAINRASDEGMNWDLSLQSHKFMGVK